MSVKRKKRFWSEDEKRSICRQTRVEGVSVAQVARRHCMNANLIFNWLKDPRFSPAWSEVEDDSVLLPVEVPELGITAAACVADLPVSCDPSISGSGVLAQRFEITLSDGRRILVEGPTELDAVVGMVKGLAS